MSPLVGRGSRTPSLRVRPGPSGL